MPKHSKVVVHSIFTTIEYECPKEPDRRHKVLLKYYADHDNHYFNDWDHTMRSFKCPVCGKGHSYKL